MSLVIELVPVSDFQQNCRIVFEAISKRAFVVDPGGDAELIEDRIRILGILVEGIYLTHSHIDHCAAVAPLLASFNVPLFGHPSEEKFRKNITTVAAMYGLPQNLYFNCPEPDIYLQEGMEIDILGIKTKIIETPGHSPGSISLWMPSEKLVFSGDVLFFDSIGRTDLPGGDYDTLLASIGRLILELPGETKVLSGHGPDTTLDREKQKNPFLSKSIR